MLSIEKMGSFPALRRKLTLGVLKKLKIPLPPLPEQQKIASILSTIDAQIAQTQEIIEQTQLLKKGLMQQLFTEGIGHTRFKETKIGRVPEEWEVVKMGEICNIKGGFAFKSKKFKERGVYQVIRIGNLYNGTLDLSRDQVFIEEINSKYKPFLLKEDDLLTTMTGTVGKRDFGYVVRIKSQKNLLLNQRVCRIQADSDINPLYLFYVCSTKKYLDQFHMMAKGGTGNQANIGTSDIEKILIPLPKRKEQGKIALLLNEIDLKIQQEQATKQRLEELKKGLMQVLLSGKVRVKLDG